jgi:hypothetical protein
MFGYDLRMPKMQQEASANRRPLTSLGAFAKPAVPLTEHLPTPYAFDSKNVSGRHFGSILDRSSSVRASGGMGWGLPALVESSPARNRGGCLLK